MTPLIGFLIGPKPGAYTVARSLLEPSIMNSSNTSKTELQRFGNDAGTAFTCPFCGLLCDDLTSAALRDATKAHCPRAYDALNAAMAESEVQPRLRGREVTLDTALDAGAELLRSAARPLFAATATDVAGTRAALSLAQASGGVIDHLHGNAMQRNLEVLQGSGWMSVNLGELHNRADLVVVLDAATLRRYPRLSQRLSYDPESVASQRVADRRVVTVGGEPEAGIEHIASPVASLGEVLGALRCVIADRPLPADLDVDAPALAALAQRMTQARYGVLIWSAQSFDFEHGDLIVQTVADLVSELNMRTRFTCLPLAPADGAATLQQVSTWKCGFPLRVGFSAGAPIYDPYHHATQRLLDRRQADLLVWLASFDASHAPPPSDIPQVVLGRPGNPASASAEVFIPVGIPGVDHPGHQFRSDGVAVLRFRQQRDIGMPTAAHVLHQLLARLKPETAMDNRC